MERPKGVSAAGLPSLVERDPSATLSLFPTLNDLLSNPNWADATPKGKICLMVFVDEVSVRVLLKLEQDKLKTSSVGRTLDDALAVLEKLLATNQVIWEQDSGPVQRYPKKGK